MAGLAGLAGLSLLPRALHRSDLAHFLQVSPPMIVGAMAPGARDLQPIFRWR